VKQSRVGIYARVSTSDQSTENQLLDLRRYSDHRGWLVQREYIDHGVSGSKDSRPALDELMKDARRRRFDIVLVVKFDRFARSARHLLNALDEFQSLGIDFCSLHDAVDTTTPYGKAMFTIAGAMAELERELIRQRVKNGVQKARERGKRLGRPRIQVDLDKVNQMLQEGRSCSIIGNVLGISRMTVAKALAENPCQKEAGTPL
jgi:DNA invertase Pin-like site-specific DNA recombinase